MDTLPDSPGIVWKVTFLDGSSCHYGVKSAAQAAARGCGTVEAIELKDKRFRLIEAGSSGKVDERKAFEKEIPPSRLARNADGTYQIYRTEIDWQLWQKAYRAALLAAKGGE